MANSEKSALATLGFLTVIEHAEHGLFGGYLVLNANGRPLEFHCTAPVKPNRAQEILYGATLKPFLFSEQIGQTLIEKGKTPPQLLFTDNEQVLAVREFIAAPVLLLWTEGLPVLSARLHCFDIGRTKVAVPTQQRDDEKLALERWPTQANHLDLSEPFSRIRDAIEEAQRTARPAA